MSEGKEKLNISASSFMPSNVAQPEDTPNRGGRGRRGRSGQARERNPKSSEGPNPSAGHNQGASNGGGRNRGGRGSRGAGTGGRGGGKSGGGSQSSRQRPPSPNNRTHTSAMAVSGNSANHLLNFRYAERPAPPAVTTPSAARKRSAGASFFNKQRYLQANFRYHVDGNVDYDRHRMDPDSLVDWECVARVVVQCPVPLSCPICLEEDITVPKVTRCGHVFCWPCILQYLSYSDKSWRRCPLCFEAVHSNDLRSAVLERVAPISAGSDVKLTLLARSKGSVVPQLASANHATQPEKRGALSLPRSDDPNALFAKLSHASHKHEFLAQEEFDLLQYEQLLVSSGEKASAVFVADALKVLRQARAVMPSWSNVDMMQDAGKEKEKERYNRKHIPAAEPSSPPDVAVVPEHFSDEVSTAAAAGTGDGHITFEHNAFFYFYQSNDGQMVFMHPSNLRALLAEYGSLDNVPKTLTVKVVDMEPVSQSEVSRKRYKLTSHLPLSCEFYLCDLDLTPLLSADGARLFKKEQQQRLKKRTKTKKEEQHRKKTQALKTTTTWSGQVVVVDDDLYIPPTADDDFGGADGEFVNTLAAVSVEDAGVEAADPNGGDGFSYSNIAKHGFGVHCMSSENDPTPSQSAGVKSSNPSPPVQASHSFASRLRQQPGSGPAVAWGRSNVPQPSPGDDDDPRGNADGELPTSSWDARGAEFASVTVKGKKKTVLMNQSLRKYS